MTRRRVRVDPFLACRTLGHSWDPIGSGDRRPTFGTMVCLRCDRCGMLRYDRFSRITGDRIGSPTYVQPEGYRDSETHSRSWYRAAWAEDVDAAGLTVDGQDEVAARRRKRRGA